MKRQPRMRVVQTRPYYVPQSGGDFFSSVDGFLRDTRILSTIAAPLISAAGIAIGTAVGPGVGSAIGANVGAAAGSYASSRLYQAGYGRARPKRKPAPRKRKPVKKRK